MIKKSVALCLLLAVSAIAAADERTKDAKLAELVKIQGLAAVVDEQLAFCERQANAVIPQMMAEIKKQLPQADEQTLHEFDAAAREFVQSVKPTWTADEAVAEWMALYGEQVSEAELEQILAYYRSPAGQKDVKASGAAMTKWTAYLGEKNQKVLQSGMSAYFERVKQIVSSAKARAAG